MINDPYHWRHAFLRRARYCARCSHGERLIAFTQSNGHWADVGGSHAGLLRHSGHGSFRRRSAHHADPYLDAGRVSPRYCRDDRLNTRAPVRCDGRSVGAGGLHSHGRAETAGAGRAVRRRDCPVRPSANAKITSSVSRGNKVARSTRGTWSTRRLHRSGPWRPRGTDPHSRWP